MCATRAEQARPSTHWPGVGATCYGRDGMGSRVREGLATVGLLVLGVGAIALPARAQQAAYGQYLLVIDDSGSMDQSDPRRLVEMAALAFAGALEDGDQVMLAGLNELASGELTGPAFVSPRELLPDRDGAEAERPIGGGHLERIALHHGQTPCHDALERARSILNSMASAGAPQTLLLLTDGACNGGAIEPAERWLSGLRAHEYGRFRFVLLMREGRERPDPTLLEYARRTGWTGEAQVSFDARGLLRSFAEVLSFSRGLRYDDGGRIGLERTFAGARTVRVLAIQEQGAARIALERVEHDASSVIPGGPTYRHPQHGWSLRVAAEAPSATPYAVRSPTAGAEVLVIPVYGRLRVEAVVAPCGDAPALPWDRERTVRAGQPACAWARLVGASGDTIHPNRSFAFQVDVCTDETCADATAMQAGADGTFHAQLGAEMPLGRHERTFRASGEGMAAPVALRRGFSAVSFGVHRVSLAETPGLPIQGIVLGTLPKATSDNLQLTVSGAFPADAHASITCEVEGDAAGAACVVCTPANDRIELSDPFTVQLTVRATDFCPAVSEGDGRQLPITLRAIIRPDGEVPEHTIPIQVSLRYARAERVTLSVTGGTQSESSLTVPGPVAQGEVTARVELESDDLRVGPPGGAERLRAGDERTVAIALHAEADDCCGAGDVSATLVLTSAAGGPELRVPLTVRVVDPGFWTCPGKQIAFFVLLALGLALLGWTVHGFVSPATFREGAILMWASSHEALLRLRDGDEGWRKLERFVETKRGFRRNAALHLGGPRAPLPSLKRLPDDAWIEASEGGGAKLVVRAEGIAKFEESNGWVEIAPGSYPIASRITLRRGDETYLQLRV